jgi:hypothetical protein
VHANGTALTKTSKLDHLVNTNFLVKYNIPMNTEETQKFDSHDLQTEIPNSDIKARK